MLAADAQGTLKRMRDSANGLRVLFFGGAQVCADRRRRELGAPGRLAVEGAKDVHRGEISPDLVHEIVDVEEGPVVHGTSIELPPQEALKRRGRRLRVSLPVVSESSISTE